MNVEPLAQPHPQWLIIHGRAVGNAFAPLGERTVRPDDLAPGLQHPQFMPCALLLFGAWALRSLVAWALRWVVVKADNDGA